MSAVGVRDQQENVLPQPDAVMKQLDWFIGAWDVVSRYYKQDEDTWLEDHLHTVHTYEMGGHIIFEHFFGPLFAKPFEAWSLRTYNANEGRWEQRWVDTSPGGFADWTGRYDLQTNTFQGYANRGRNEDGTLNQRAARETFSEITANSFAWKYEMTEDGGETWRVMWTLDYTRAVSDNSDV